MGTAASPPWLLESPSGMFVFKRTGKQCTGPGSIFGVCLRERTASANVTQPVGRGCPGGILVRTPPSPQTRGSRRAGLAIPHGSARSVRRQRRFRPSLAAPRFRPRPFARSTTAGWPRGVPDIVLEPPKPRGAWRACIPSSFTGRRGGPPIKI
jgi:hypothetical protein